MADLATLEQRALAELQVCGEEAALRAWNTRYFGKQGEVLLAIKKVGEVPPAERRNYGQQANKVKETLTQAYESALAQEKERCLQLDLTANALDVTLPGRPVPRGRLHLATQVLRDIYAVFADLGFQVYRSREV